MYSGAKWGKVTIFIYHVVGVTARTTYLLLGCWMRDLRVPFKRQVLKVSAELMRSGSTLSSAQSQVCEWCAWHLIGHQHTCTMPSPDILASPYFYYMEIKPEPMDSWFSSLTPTLQLNQNFVYVFCVIINTLTCTLALHWMYQEEKFNLIGSWRWGTLHIM